MKSNIFKAVLKIFLFWFYSFNTSNVLNAQTASAKQDSTYIDNELRIASNLFRKDNVHALEIAKRALEISKKISYNKGIVKSYYTIGNINNISAKFDIAKQAYEKALEQAEINKDRATMQLCYTSLGNVSSKLDDYKKAIGYYQQSAALSQALNDIAQVVRSNIGISMVMIKIKEYDQWNTYSSIAIEKATQDSNPLNLVLAIHDRGAAFHRMGKERKMPAFYDSAMFYYKQAQKLLQLKVSVVEGNQILFISQNDMGSLFLEKKLYDSAKLYLENALQGAIKQNNVSIICSIYNDLGQIATVNKEFEKSEKYLQDAINMAQKISFERKRAVYKNLMELATAKGSYKKALEYQLQMMNCSDSLYNTEKANAVNNLNIRYETKQKENEIEQLKRESVLQKRIKYFSISLALIGLIAILLLIRSFKLQQKVNIQNEKLLKEEKENAVLLNKQVDAEKEKTIMRSELEKKEKNKLEAEIAIQKLQEEKMQKEIEAIQRELSVYVMQTEKKNELISTLKNQLKEIEAKIPGVIPSLKETYKLLDKTLDIENDFDKFSFHFQKVHPLFFQQLLENSGYTLSPLDLKYCAYMKMNLSTKEIANLLNVNSDSIRVTRHRLKQKLKLNKDDDLVDFLLKL
jgi:DNA-binding CsgD family transcriptional regulator